MKNLRGLKFFTFALAALSALGTAGALLAQHQMESEMPSEMPSGGDEALIASAMRAAPPAVSKDATVIDVGADAAIRVVRQGTNGFTCMADNPATPGPDSMCSDANAMAWVDAWIHHTTPPPGKVGFMYMLEGGTDASNTDPWATAPSADNHWIQTGPHVMVVGAAAMMEGYPRGADPDTSVPYVMWPDTPYEHLMIPVK